MAQLPRDKCSQCSDKQQFYCAKVVDQAFLEALGTGEAQTIVLRCGFEVVINTRKAGDKPQIGTEISA